MRSWKMNSPTGRRTGTIRVAAAVPHADGSIGGPGWSACTVQPKEVIVPYVRQPEQFVSGNPLFYATAMGVAGVSTGLLVESHLGRPTKIEGNPQHPASLGATDAAMQASVLTLYDPDRSQAVTRNGAIDGWATSSAR